jgi:hypothetical protein
MATKTESRRRNAYPGNCCHCGREVAVGEGWLYSDTRQRPGFSGRFPKKVKCDRCHSEGVTNSWQAKNLDAPAGPTPRRWSVGDVRRWAIESRTVENIQVIGYEEGFRSIWGPGKVVVVEAIIGGQRVELAGENIIGANQRGLDGRLEEAGVGGRAFTRGAWKTLGERVRAAIDAGK